MLMIGILLLAVACISTATPVRNQRQASSSCSLPHCSCSYSEWSEWEVESGATLSVATSVCASGEAYNERRTRSSVEGGCNDEMQSRRVCK